jgi:HK97 family phage major capsid protein
MCIRDRYSSDFIDLDDAQNGSGSKAVVFGDLRRAYEIYDMLGINVVRDDLTKADQAITQWIFRRYNYGRVIMPEALKILQIQ